MKQVLTLTILAAIFTFNVANAKQAPVKTGKSKVSTHAVSVKKMKDTSDQLMSNKQQNKIVDYSTISA
jgi:hypothetical protein